MTILDKIRTYYLYYFIMCCILFSPLFLIGALKGNDVFNTKGFLVYFGLVGFVSVFTGGMIQFIMEFYIPRKAKKLFEKNKDISLTELGLKIDEVNQNWTGTYQKYYLIALLEDLSREGNFMIVNVPIKYDENYKTLKQFELIVGDEVRNGNKQAWYTSKTKLLANNRIDIPILKRDVDDMIETLRAENIQPEKP